MAVVARFFYSICFYALLPMVFIRLWQRGQKTPAYRLRWSERLGHVPFSLDQCIWLHSVSLGETIAATPLIKHLIEMYPDTPILVTTTTPTGSDQVIKTFKDTVHHCYFPYDLPGALKRFTKRVNPKALIIMETELWPNLLAHCKCKQIPVLLANARLSQRSADGYARFQSISKTMMKQLTIIAAQNQNDAARFIDLGAAEQKLIVTGNIKFDLTPPGNIMELSQPLRDMWSGRPVWIAASTHDGEEQRVLAAHHQLCQALPDCLLILVPRHPERFEQVANLIDQQGFQFVRRNSGQLCHDKCQVFLGDTMGEMMLFYASAQVAFVGGSLVPVGGHNLLEPAALSLPSLTGPHVHNFKEITKMLLDSKATLMINDADSLAHNVLSLLKDERQRQEMGQSGQEIVQNNRGAKAKLVEVIQQFLAATK